MTEFLAIFGLTVIGLAFFVGMAILISQGMYNFLCWLEKFMSDEKVAVVGIVIVIIFTALAFASFVTAFGGAA